MGKITSRFRKGDWIAIGCVLLAAVALLLPFLPEKTGADPRAEIYRDGTLIKTVSLSEDQEFTVSGTYSNTICVRNGKISVTRSDCPGGDCIRCGWLDRTGRNIVCLPNALEIRVVSGSNDVDFVVR